MKFIFNLDDERLLEGLDKIDILRCSKENDNIICNIYINIDDKMPFNENISNKTEFLRCLKENIKDTPDLEDYKEEYNELYNYLNNDFNNIINDTEYIEVVPTNSSLEYINNNPSLQNKKIVINEEITINDFKKVQKIVTKFDKYKENLYFKVRGNYRYTSLEDYMYTNVKISEIAGYIKDLNLSPIETIMYVYDIVKDREYKQEDNGIYEDSRDLTAVLKGDKIVCVGYVNMFNAILEKLNFNCKGVLILTKSDQNEGHERSIVYVKDPKYKINGVYYFDPTWDSKKNQEHDKFKYRFFCKTDSQFKELEKDNYINEYLNITKEKNDDIEKAIINNEYDYLLKEYLLYINRIFHMSGDSEFELLFKCKLEQIKSQELLKLYQKALNKFYKPLPAETMIKIYNEVRKVEEDNENIDEKKFINDLYRAYVYSKWEFNKKYFQNIGYYRLMGEDFEKDSPENFINFIDNAIKNNELDKLFIKRR